MREQKELHHDTLDSCWPRQLVLTDTPESWSDLVEQIAELEELLNDLESERDADDLHAAARVRALLQTKRRCLRAIDVG